MSKSAFSEKYRFLLFGTLIILAVDQYTKFLVRSNFELHETLPVIEGFFNITFIFNRGAAFSFLSDVGSPWVGRMFIIVSCIAIAVIIAIYREIEDENRTLKLALVLILGGAAGNLLDRLFLGQVTDFLDFYIADHHWPVFNIADSCISIGVTIIALSWIGHFSRRKDSENAG